MRQTAFHLWLLMLSACVWIGLNGSAASDDAIYRMSELILMSALRQRRTDSDKKSHAKKAKHKKKADRKKKKNA